MAELRPKLSDSITFAPTGITNDSAYRLHDTASKRFFEIGYAEYVLLSLLDGQTSVAEAMSLAAQAYRKEALSLAEVTALLRWAASVDILSAGAKQQPPPSPWTLFGAINPLWMKLPLPSPEKAIDLLAPALSWTQSRWVAAPMVALTIAALLSGLAHAAEISRAFTGILAVTNWLPLAIVWTVLKLWHEIGHALACRRHRVPVANCGIVFILFAPCPYVDATASWALRSRWSRIHIAAAGMLAELLVATLVLISWPALQSGLGFDPDWTQQLAANALFSATVATLLFNANPLMKFDGYYMLSDLTDTPNLATRGSKAVQTRLASVLYGEQLRTREPVWIEIYGWAAAIWRIVVTVSLTAAATVLLPGIGLPIAIAGAVLSFAPGLIGAIRSMRQRLQTAASPLRPVAISMLLLATVFAMGFMPWPFHETAPGITVVPEHAAIRATTSGFVQTIPVSTGEAIGNGDIILTLYDDETQTRRVELHAEIERSLVRQQMLEADQKLAEAQLESDDRSRLRRQLALIEERVAESHVTATQTGVVEAQTPLSQRMGTYLREGDEIAIVQSNTPIEIEAAVQDRLIDFVRGSENQTTAVVLPSGRSVEATIRRIAPSATTRPIDDTLCASFAGPIAASRQSDDELETTQPHVPMTLTVSSEYQALFRPGMRVSVHLCGNESTAAHLWRQAGDWWSDLIHTERHNR